MQGVIYKVTNLLNGKVYVGQTIRSLNTRIKCHKESKHALGAAFRKYGMENFRISVIDNAEDRQSLNEKEIFWIKFFKCFSKAGYNLTSGGDAPAEYAPETCAKISASKLGKKRTPEERARMSVAALNRSPEAKANVAASKKNISNETRAKQSVSHTGKKQSTETVAKRIAANTGRKRTPEFCARHSEETKRRSTPEVRAGISARMMGNNPSPEIRAKMSESAKARAQAMSPEVRAEMTAKTKATWARKAAAKLESHSTTALP